MHNFMCSLLCTVFLLPFSNSIMAQETSPIDIAAEIQVYPTGIISGIRLERGLTNKSSLHLRLARQDIDHEDYGKQDDEQGDGYGFSLGYRYFLNPGYKGFSFGVKTDVWFNTIDWANDLGTAQESNGTTKVIVLQPTATIGYQHWFSSKLFVSPSLAAGFEINVDTDGEEVGEGAIWLFGLTLGTRI